MRLLVSKHSPGVWAAHYVSQAIKRFNPSIDRPFILGLPTGSTPLEMYKHLILLNKQQLVSFKHVVTFNMDEYVGLAENHVQSYHYYMTDNFFKHIDIDMKNVNILNGNAKDLDEECKLYEKKILSYGGIDLLIGGVGEDGHIAFNEPGSSLNSVTRVKTLNYSTILSNSRFFDHNVENMPGIALTMGIKTILDAKEILILAEGVKKSMAVHHAIEGAISSMCPITALQLHRNAAVICDKYAAFELKLKTIHYFDYLKDEYHSLEHELSDLQ